MISTRSGWLFSPGALSGMRKAGLAGVALMVIGWALCPAQMWPGALLAAFLVLSMGLGAAFFMALTSVCNARWNLPFQRVPAVMAAQLPWLAGVTGLVVLGGLPYLYEWSHAADGAHGGPTGFKQVWLQPGFFSLRAAVCLLLWVVLGWALVRSVRRLSAGDDRLRVRPGAGLSALFVVIFAITFLTASFDWFMSIESHWFSTIFGVYNFAGTFLGTLAAITLAVVLMRKTGRDRHAISDAGLHDLGKLLAGFSVFWAYIWFSQYMLIWYSNLPEETSHYLPRQSGGWHTLFVLNFILNWALPFFVLLPRRAKTDEGVLLKVCLILLVGRVLDLYLMVIPAFSDRGVGVHLWTIALLVLGIGAFSVRVLSRLASPPVGSPFPAE